MDRPDLSIVIKCYPDDIPAQRVHPAADLFPPMSDDEFTALVADLAVHGLAVPILVTEEGELLDGRNRLAACYAAKVDPVFERSRAPDPWSTVLSLNRNRRNLTIGQLAAIGRAFKQHYAEQAAAQEKNRKSAIKDLTVADPPPLKSRDKAGADVGISGRRISEYERVERVAPELAERVKAGTLALDAATKQAKKIEKLMPQTDPVPAPTTITTPIILHTGATMMVSKPKAKPTFNPTNEHISWAAWSWNPVTGCLHGCTYCYARAISEPASAAFPAGFAPVFRPERIEAPTHTTYPHTATDPRQQRVFVCSMADLFGQWVPQNWIDAVFDAANRTPEWDYLFLTKFPQRYKRLTFPPGAWAGASVDTQKRVQLTERAMKPLRGDPNVAVRWLSIEPLLEPLTFDDLSWCDLMVIGAQTATRQPTGWEEEFAPPFEWVADLVGQARAAGVPVYLKPNLVGDQHAKAPGMLLPQEPPRGITAL